MKPLAALLLLALPACASGGLLDERITGADYRTGSTRAGFSAFAAAGPVVQIFGAPPGGAAPEEIAAALQLPAAFAQTPFSLADPGSTAGQRLVLAFGVPGGVDVAGLCAGRAAASGVTDRLEVAAAFCVGSRPGSGAKLSHVEPLAPGDPRFTEAMRRLFQTVAPRRSDRRPRDR